MRRAPLFAVAVGAAALVVSATSLRADDHSDSGPAGDPWEEVVFLPESSLGILLERDPRGVLLERSAYLDLHRRARAAGSGHHGSLDGLPSGVLRCDVDGVVTEDGDSARLEVHLTVNARGEGRQTVAIDLGGSVEDARLGDAPATLGAVGGTLSLVVPSAGLHNVHLTVLTPIVRVRGLRTVSLRLPHAAASRWTLTLPGRVTATVTGALARIERLTDPDQTRLVAFGATDTLSASWSEGAGGTDLPPLVRATVNALAEVGARAMDVTALVQIECTRSPRDTFPLRIPDDLTVLGVDGDGASLVTAADGSRTLRFAESFTGTRTVMVRATRALAGPGATALPILDLPGSTTVARRLGVRFTDGLRGVVDVGGGAERLDTTLSKQGAVSALLRLGPESTAVARTERPAGRLHAELRALLDLADDGPWLTVAILYRPRGDRLYGVDPLLPEGFLPETVAVAPDQPVLRGTTPDGRLSLVFPAGIDDGGAVTVTIRGRWPQDGWTADSWVAGGAGRDAPLPRLDGGTVAETEGFLGVAAPAGTEVRDEESMGLVPTAVTELRQRASFLADGLSLGWRFRGSAPGGRLRVTRPEPSLTASTALLVIPAEDHVSLSGVIGLTVQRGGVREVRVSVDPPLGDLLRIDGVDVAEKELETAPGGGDVWVIRFVRAVRDVSKLTLSADLATSGDGDTVAIPSIRVEGAARADSEVGVSAAGELDVSIDASGLRDADQAELSPLFAAHPSGLLRAWRVERDVVPTLTVGATRLAPSPLPATFADSVTLRSVIGMDDIVRTRLDARIRNVDRQALEVTLPPGARLATARVAGEAVRPVRRGGVLLVPIVPSTAPFDVVLFYEEPIDGGATEATLAAPDLGVPGNRAVWTVHLPEGAVPLGADGDFSAPAPRPGSPLLIRWLASSKVVVRGASYETSMDATGKPPARSRLAAGAPRPQGAEMQPDLEEDVMDWDGDDGAGAGEVPPDSREPSDPRGPTTGAGESGGPSHGGAPGLGDLESASRRIDARAAERGLFGMDLRLLAAGPSITATRLGPTGSVHVDWRSESGRRTAALIAGLLAFLTALFFGRRGLGALPWSLLALGAFAALPIAFAAVDTSVWDGATLGTLAFAAVAFVRWVGRIVARRVRWPGRVGRAASGAALLLLVAAPALANDAKARSAPPPQDVATSGPVYVPFDPARPETLRTPERVFLPYARYRELWNRAHPEERIESTLQPLVVGANYAGRIDGRVLVVDATWEIDPEDGGLVALPPGAAVADLTLDGKPVTATSAAPGGATLVHVARGGDGLRSVLAATLRWPIGGTAPGGVVSVPLPRAPGATLSLDVPLADAVVEVASAGGFQASQADGGTRVVAELGPVDRLEVTWRPRGADAAGGRTRFEVDTESVSEIGPEVIEWRADIVLRVLSGTIRELDATVPATLEITSVEGPAVASWTIAGGTSLRLRLLGVAPGETKIALRGVIAVAAGSAEVPVLTVPDLVVTGASADRHRIAVSATRGRIVPVERTGVERTDAAGGSVVGTLAFRRVRIPATLRVRAEPAPGGLGVVARHHLHLAADRSLLRTELDLTPGPRGLHEARVALPAGWALEDDAGAEIFVEGSSLRLVFTGQASAARKVVLRLRGPAAGSDAFAVPALRVVGAERESAEVLVSTIPALAATVVVQENAEPYPVERLSAWPALGDAEVRALAWRTPRGAPRLQIRREELRTTLRPTVVADLTVLDDRVIVDALIHWDVRGGPAGVFAVDSPPGVRDAWVLGEGLREVRREDVGGRERLTVTMQAATTGTVAFRVLYDLPVPATGALVVAGPEPVGGDGARSFLLLRAMGEAEVRIGDTPSLETCDVSDLPLVPEGLDPLRVLRFLRARDAAWRLPLELAAHELGELPDARIHLVEATTVADRDGSTRTRVEVRLFNHARAFLPVRLPAGATLEAVIVAGAPVRPVVRAEEQGSIQVPVRVQSLGEDSQVVALTFRTPASVPGGRFDELTPRLAEFPGVPVDATTWRLVLPTDREYSFSGNLDPVEEVEVAIARAEAYASGVRRLRTVMEKGSKRQQVVAAANIMSNSVELQQTLDVARARMDSLERAAAEGRVDPARLRESRRKADELAKNIAEVLDEVASVEQSTGAYYRDDANGAPTGATAALENAQMEFEKQVDEQSLQDRLATKEGQAGKRWASNSRAAEPPELDEVARAQREVWDVQVPGAASGSLTIAGDAFDNALKGRDLRVGLVVADPTFQSDAPFEGPGTNGTIGIGGGAGGEFTGRVTASESGTFARGYAFGGGGGGGGERMADGAGLADRGRLAPPVSGLISLEPELVQEGRTYAFRKLEANAELEIRATSPGNLRRWTALGLFLLLAAVVLGVRSKLATGRR